MLQQPFEQSIADNTAAAPQTTARAKETAGRTRAKSKASWTPTAASAPQAAAQFNGSFGSLADSTS